MHYLKAGLAVLTTTLVGCATTPPLPEPRPGVVKIEFQIFEIQNDAIPSLTKKEAFSLAHLDTLLETGKATLVTSCAVSTLSGVEATVKGVTEYIYPTEFSVIQNALELAKREKLEQGAQTGRLPLGLDRHPHP